MRTSQIIFGLCAYMFAQTLAQEGSGVTCAKLSAAYLISDCCGASDQQTAMVSTAALTALCPSDSGGLGQSVGYAPPSPGKVSAPPPPASPPRDGSECDDEICQD